MKPTAFFLLTASIFLAPLEALSQVFFQKYIAEAGFSIDVHALSPVQNDLIAVGGQIASTSTGDKMAAIQLFSKDGALIWSRQFGNLTSQATIVDIEPTPDGNLLAVARAESANGQTGIFKIDLNGNLLWARFFNNNSNHEINRAQNTTGGFILTGTQNSTDGLIIKTDANGLETWSVRVTAIGALSLHQATEDALGNIYVTGSVFQFGYTDGVLLKFFPTGQLQWSRRFGTSENDVLTHLVQTGDQQFLAGGYSFGADNIRKGWLLQMDSEGLVKWSRSYANSSAGAEIRSLHAYPGGAVFSITETGTTPTLGAGLGRVNFAGDLLWVKNYNQSGSFGLNPLLALSANDNLLLAASLQTGSGRGCLLARANSTGDTPPCCLKSFNLQVLDLPVNNSVFIPTTAVADMMAPAAWPSTAVSLQQTSLCSAFNLDFTVSDSVLCPGDCVDLEIVDPSPGATYSWSYPGGISNPTLPNQVCFPNLAAETTITLTANVCLYSQSQRTVQLESGKNKYPNAFTPDGDGYNDSFLPLLPCPNPEYHFSIYSRWGALVFETFESGTGWDGRVNGEAAPTDVYIWLLKTQAGDNVLLEKGTVTLLR